MPLPLRQSMFIFSRSFAPHTTMTDIRKHQIITYLIATVWLINGLICKVLNLVPRHQEIVARILGDNHARVLTLLIGLSEIAIAVWIISGIWRRLNAITQILGPSQEISSTFRDARQLTFGV